MAKDRWGFGTEEKSWLKKLLSGQQIPFSEKLMRKSLGDDQTEYFLLKEEIGEDNINKLTEIFVNEHVSKNPELGLSDLNNFIITSIKEGMNK